jgi:hypothetical protein
VGAPARGLGLGFGSLAVKEFQPIDKIDFIAKKIDLLGVCIDPMRLDNDPGGLSKPQRRLPAGRLSRLR